MAENDIKSMCGEILSKLTKNGNSAPFLAPVDPVELGIPDYFDVIKKPMDLSTVKKKLNSGKYKALSDFKNDIDLMLENCFTYNPEGTYVYNAGMDLQKYFLTLWNKIPVDEEVDKMRKIQLELEKPKYKRFSWPFLEPVDTTLVPDYLNVIKYPVDLQTLKKKIDGNEIDLSEYKRQLNLMIQNCYQFNPPSSEVRKCGEEMERLIKKLTTDETLESYKVRVQELEKQIERYEKKKVKRYTQEARIQLAEKASNVSQSKAREILLLIKEHQPYLDITDTEEVEVDFATLPDILLEEIKERIDEGETSS